MKKIIVLTLALILTLTLTACSAASDRVADKFFNTFSTGTYHMKAKVIDSNAEATMEMFVKKDLTAMNIQAQGQKMRMVMRDNKMHMIDDEQKMVMIMPMSMQAVGNAASAKVDTEVMRYVGSGKANFHGKNLPYDEYSIDGGGKSQLFVDGSKLAGVRNISNGTVIDVVVLELDQNVPDSVFQIPAGYTQMSF